jgi:hypothetical protein
LLGTGLIVAGIVLMARDDPHARAQLPDPSRDAGQK